MIPALWNRVVPMIIYTIVGGLVDHLVRKASGATPPLAKPTWGEIPSSVAPITEDPIGSEVRRERRKMPTSGKVLL